MPKTKAKNKRTSQRRRSAREINAAANRTIKAIHFGGSVTIQAAEGEGDAAKGPAKFDVVAYTGGMLSVDAYDLPVVVDLQGMTPLRSLVANLDHDRTKRVGNVTDYINDGKKLRLGGIASAKTAARDEVVGSAVDGFIWQASIEAAPTAKLESVARGKVVYVNGQSFTGPLLVARQSKLKGFAFVSHGADDNTNVSIAAAAASHKGTENMNPKFKKWLEAMGFDPDELTAEQLAGLEANFNGKHAATSTADDDDDIDSVVAAKKRKRERNRAIAKLASEAMEDHPGSMEEIEALAKTAQKEDWSTDRFELEVLRATRPQSHTVRGSSRHEIPSERVLEAALCRSGNLSSLEDRFDDQTLDAVDRRFRHGLGVVELLLSAARANGCDHLSIHNTREVLEAAFYKDVRGSQNFSTINVSSILSNVGNKFLMDAFNAVEQEWRKIAAIGTATDFKEITSHSLTGDLTYKKLDPAGQIEHGTLGERTNTNKLDTYARMLALTRQDLINDDLGAFTKLNKRLGRGGGLAINEVFWPEFLDNATFFTTALGNLDEGTDTAFDADGLELADTNFSALKDPDGNPLGAMPKVLVVPPAFKIAAQRLMRSQKISEDGGACEENPWAGMFTVASSQYMVNTKYEGASPKKWYLLADPNDIPVIEMLFLLGQQSPTIESAAADFDYLGIRIRAFHDFGARKQEKLGGIAMKGET